MRKSDEGRQVLCSEPKRRLKDRSSSKPPSVKCVPNLTQLRARADQKCVKPSFLLEKISEVGIGSKRATSAPAMFAAP